MTNDNDSQRLEILERPSDNTPGEGRASVPGQAWARWRVPMGYLVGFLSVVSSRPTWLSIAAGTGIALLGLVVRAIAAGHLRKAQALTDTGPYARTRNPLYLGSVLLAAGFAVGSHSWIPALLLGTYFAVFYPPVMRREEAHLRSHFGDAFEEYARRVPLFLPRLRLQGKEGKTQFSFAQYRQNREYTVAIGALLLWTCLSLMALWRR